MVAVAQIGLRIFDHCKYVEYPGQYKDYSPGDLSDFRPFVTDNDQNDCNDVGDDIRKPVVRQIHRSSPFLASLSALRYRQLHHGDDNRNHGYNTPNDQNHIICIQSSWFSDTNSAALHCESSQNPTPCKVEIHTSAY